MYNTILDQAGKLTQSKWKAATPVPGPAIGGGTGILGAGSVWSSTVASGREGERDLVEGINGMSLGRRSADNIENVNMIASQR